MVVAPEMQSFSESRDRWMDMQPRSPPGYIDVTRPTGLDLFVLMF